MVQSLNTVINNGRAVSLDNITILNPEQFTQAITGAVAFGERVAAFFGKTSDKPDTIELFAVLADDDQNELKLCRTEITGYEYTSITPKCPQVHMFERELAEQFGVKVKDHPWFKPVRYHKSYTSADAWGRSADTEILPAVCDFYKLDGEQVHEVAVGPVHAGIIEPGHFRFQCHGEMVYHLEIALGYQHRGIEKALINGPDKRSLYFAETIAGDTTIGHGISYCQVVEALSNCYVSPRAQALRGIALELERLANHTGDLGALAQDIGFLPTSSFCGRIRGDFLNMSAVLCGSRFGRSFMRYGGVAYDIDQARVDDLLKRLDAAETDVTVAVNLLWDTQSVMARFEKIGVVSNKTAQDLGLVGPAARATGLLRDVRNDHSCGIYCFTHIPVSMCNSGDVFARAYVRWLEIQHSVKFIREQLQALPGGRILTECKKVAPSSIAVALTEGWRGEVCHVGITDESGKFSRYKIVDPSFHNWPGLAMALRNQQISDFPICNKSFNLSYCGHDL
jgi:Ni,Fe-hydrogenase III large subunit